ncbi:MAG: flavodoxin-dependent (E)-4-hydroxy-3-methylbut-2-enyl-diphosphate synthase [Acidobacteria bacterium]|nr:flavodoxin-dependent (E)-4-hydroxy-3-methylbut-2-enyl-diphosphate synthase [Acidobacteriota bacterium]
MKVKRRESRPVRVGEICIGGGAPVSVQSMTNTDPHDASATSAQVRRLADAGCELVRLAVPDRAAAETLAAVCRESPVPLAADIHFDYRLALAALDAGVAKLRLNPGNIGSARRVRLVAAEAARRGVPIRVGVNAGSLERDLLERHGRATPGAMVESALRHVALLEAEGFRDIVISLKASDVPEMVEAYRAMAARVDYPLHLGVTEAGDARSGTVASAVGIGALLLDGIGDTIRVSLTAPPEEEVRAGFEILSAAGVRQRGPRFVSCPTCGRTTVDLIDVASRVRRALSHLKAPLRIAVMGCEVNGPGEAADADIGLACGRKRSLIFRSGRQVKVIPNDRLVEEFVAEVLGLAGDDGAGPNGRPE